MVNSTGRRDAPATAPAVSVVVATHNRAHLLDRLVNALRTQSGAEAAEFILVNDGSVDETASTLKRLAADTDTSIVAVQLDTSRGPGGARNEGWRRARAPL